MFYLLLSCFLLKVICAFGRLGTMFGCDKYNIKPDLVSLAKVNIKIVLGNIPFSSSNYNSSFNFVPEFYFVSILFLSPTPSKLLTFM